MILGSNYVYWSGWFKDVWIEPYILYVYVRWVEPTYSILPIKQKDIFSFLFYRKRLNILASLSFFFFLFLLTCSSFYWQIINEFIVGMRGLAESNFWWIFSILYFKYCLTVAWDEKYENCEAWINTAFYYMYKVFYFNKNRFNNILVMIIIIMMAIRVKTIVIIGIRR